MKKMGYFFSLFLLLVFTTGSTVFANFSVERDFETFESSDTVEVTLTIRPLRQADVFELPTDIVLTLDASPSMVMSWDFDAWAPTKETAISFVENFRNTDTRMSTFSYDREIEMDSDVTRNIDDVVQSIEDMDIFWTGGDMVGHGALDYGLDPTIYPGRGWQGSGTALAHALRISIDQAADNYQNGRQPVVVFLTDADANYSGGPHNVSMDMAENAVRDFYNDYGGRVFFISLVANSDEFTRIEEIGDTYGGGAYFSPTGAELDSIYTDIVRRINNIAAVKRVATGDVDLPMVVEVLPHYLEYVEGSMTLGEENTIGNILSNYDVTAVDSLTQISFFIDEFLYTDVFQVTYRARVTEPLQEEIEIVITRDMDDNNYSRMQYVRYLTGQNVDRPTTGGQFIRPNRNLIFEIKVHEALFDGDPEYRGDSVSYGEGFSIEIIIVNENGDTADYINGMKTLTFDWGYDGNSIPIETSFVFVDGRVVIDANDFPFVINNSLFNNLTITDNTGISGEKGFDVLMPPGFSVDGSPIIYDRSGDGFQDFIVIRFTDIVDTTHLIDNKDIIKTGFSFQADYYRSDNLSWFFEVDDIEIVNERTIGLVITMSSDTVGENLFPKTAIEPVLEYNMPDSTISIRGTEFGVFLNNGIYATQEMVGMVINRAFLDNAHDGFPGTNRLRLLLSEDIDYGKLEFHTPFDGIMILVQVENGLDTLFLPFHSQWLNPLTYEGNEVIVTELKDFDFEDTEIYFVKLIRNGVFIDLNDTDVHVENPPRILEVSGGYSQVDLVPNPVYKPGSSDGGKGYGNGAVFRIRTNVPLSIDILFTNAHGNVMNTFKMEITKETLERYGQVRDEMKTVYFGPVMDNGYLRVVDPAFIDSENFDVSSVPERHRWMPVNKSGRFVEAGAHIMRMDVKKVEGGKGGLWDRSTLVIIVM